MGNNEIWTVVERDADGDTLPWAGAFGSMDEAMAAVVHAIAELAEDESIWNPADELSLVQETPFPSGRRILRYYGSDEHEYTFVQHVDHAL